MIKATVLLLIFFSNAAYSEAYNSFKLLNNSVQAVFPSYPQSMDVSYIPNHKQLNISMFTSADNSIPVAYLLRARDFSQDKEIGAYNNTIKALEDNLFKQNFLNFGGSISEFASKFNKSKNTYTAEITGSVNLDGYRGYRSELVIIYKRRVYQWSVVYKDKRLKEELFDNYKSDFKILSN